MPQHSDRLHAILTLLRDGQRHRASDIAAHVGASLRTIYRDMERLVANGLPITGTRGAGYHLRSETVLPPLSLPPDQLEALQLGLAIVAEAQDPALSAAARALADQIDAGLPMGALAPAEMWKFAPLPLADATRSFAHMASLRGAIRGRQKLQITALQPDGTAVQHILRPLRLDHMGRIWLLTGWSDSANRFVELRTDLITQATALPELFVDDPGKTLADLTRAQPSSNEVTP